MDRCGGFPIPCWCSPRCCIDQNVDPVPSTVSGTASRTHKHGLSLLYRWCSGHSGYSDLCVQQMFDSQDMIYIHNTQRQLAQRLFPQNVAAPHWSALPVGELHGRTTPVHSSLSFHFSALGSKTCTDPDPGDCDTTGSVSWGPLHACTTFQLAKCWDHHLL